MSQRAQDIASLSQHPRPILTKSLMAIVTPAGRLAAPTSAANDLDLMRHEDGDSSKRRRVVKKDPDKPCPKAWSKKEITHLKSLVDQRGPGEWENKAVVLGSGRSAKALHTRWLRDQGRIVDRPRGLTGTSEEMSAPAPKSISGTRTPELKPIVTTPPPLLEMLPARQNVVSKPMPPNRGAFPFSAAAARTAARKPTTQKRKRVVIRDPTKPTPKSWTQAELDLFESMVEKDGPGDWVAKAARLEAVHGSARSAKALHTRWLRQQGRIVDKPRGRAALKAQAAENAQSALEALMLLASF
jgi:hypothetical protein